MPYLLARSCTIAYSAAFSMWPRRQSSHLPISFQSSCTSLYQPSPPLTVCRSSGRQRSSETLTPVCHTHFAGIDTLSMPSLAPSDRSDRCSHSVNTTAHWRGVSVQFAVVGKGLTTTRIAQKERRKWACLNSQTPTRLPPSSKKTSPSSGRDQAAIRLPRLLPSSPSSAWTTTSIGHRREASDTPSSACVPWRPS
jgi:hypothetical protein